MILVREAVVDADWIREWRDDDVTNAETTSILWLTVRATKSSIISDDEGEEKDLMMWLMMMVKRREGLRSRCYVML
jgi:hypothetical protein